MKKEYKYTEQTHFDYRVTFNHKGEEFTFLFDRLLKNAEVDFFNTASVVEVEVIDRETAEILYDWVASVDDPLGIYDFEMMSKRIYEVEILPPDLVKILSEYVPDNDFTFLWNYWTEVDYWDKSYHSLIKHLYLQEYGEDTKLSYDELARYSVSIRETTAIERGTDGWWIIPLVD